MSLTRSIPLGRILGIPNGDLVGVLARVNVLAFVRTLAKVGA